MQLMSDDKKYWLDDRENVDKVVYGLCIVCALVGAARPVSATSTTCTSLSRTGSASTASTASSPASALVLAAKQLRKVVMRDEDYYD